MYRSNTSFGSGEVILTIFWRWFLSAWRASLCSGPHSNLFALRRTLKNGRLRSAERGINLFRAAIRPVSFCTSLMDLGSSMFQRAFTLSGFASIPLVDTRHPSTFPFVNSKDALVGVQGQPCFS